jgi:hypothetical protein
METLSIFDSPINHPIKNYFRQGKNKGQTRRMINVKGDQVVILKKRVGVHLPDITERETPFQGFLLLINYNFRNLVFIPMIKRMLLLNSFQNNNFRQVTIHEIV